MKTNFFKIGLSAVLLVSSVSLTGCGGRIQVSNPTQALPQPQQTMPDNSFYNEPSYNDPSYSNPNNGAYNTIPQGQPNASVGSFAVDQDMANQWQAKGIAVSSGIIYVTAADNRGLFKKGTVIKMSATDGKKWENLGGKWLGMRHPMDGTVSGLAVAGGAIVATDTQGKIYTLDATKGGVKVVSSGGGTDAAYAGGAVFIANGSVERSDASASSRSPIPGLMTSGGIGGDNMGNVYAANGTIVKKADSSGMVSDLITSDLQQAVDVAVDSRQGFGDVYVLDGTMIKRFTANGQFVVSFASGAAKPVGISVDETGAVYVADGGATHKDSKVFKFSPATDMNGSIGNGYNNYSNNNNQQFGSYSSYGSRSGNYNSYNSYNNNRGY